jgi:hypothetical protein
VTPPLDLLASVRVNLGVLVVVLVAVAVAAEVWATSRGRDDELDDDECPMCGWQLGTNAYSCGECREELDILDLPPAPQDEDWRVSHALAAESDVRIIQDWLRATDEVLELFERDEELAAELRAVASLVKTRRNDLIDDARTMRARVRP